MAIPTDDPNFIDYTTHLTSKISRYQQTFTHVLHISSSLTLLPISHWGSGWWVGHKRSHRAPSLCSLPGWLLKLGRGARYHVYILEHGNICSLYGVKQHICFVYQIGSEFSCMDFSHLQRKRIIRWTFANFMLKLRGTSGGIKQALDKGHMSDSKYSVAAAHSDCCFASGPCWLSSRLGSPNFP